MHLYYFYTCEPNIFQHHFVLQGYLAIYKYFVLNKNLALIYMNVIQLKFWFTVCHNNQFTR